MYKKKKMIKRSLKNNKIVRRCYAYMHAEATRSFREDRTTGSDARSAIVSVATPRKQAVKSVCRKLFCFLCCFLQRSDKRLVFKCAQQVELYTTLSKVCMQSVEYLVGISTRRLKRVWLEEIYNFRRFGRQKRRLTFRYYKVI